VRYKPIKHVAPVQSPTGDCILQGAAQQKTARPGDADEKTFLLLYPLNKIKWIKLN
jgi:hypothetical protein